MIFDFLSEYLSIIIFLFIALALSIGFVAVNFAFSPKNPDPEKLSAYECGFEAFSDSRIQFEAVPLLRVWQRSSPFGTLQMYIILIGLLRTCHILRSGLGFLLEDRFPCSLARFR